MRDSGLSQLIFQENLSGTGGDEEFHQHQDVFAAMVTRD
jgi:hypothetical protein